MGGSCYDTNVHLPLCANCGLRTGKKGSMGSTAWGHGKMCCSDACGIRLKKRIENGMVEGEAGGFPYYNLPKSMNANVDGMRFRIKQLEHQIKELGGKCRRMPEIQ